MEQAFYAGIDPGTAGGIAVVDNLGAFVSAVKMPETERDLLDHLQFMRKFGQVRATLEFVRAMPKMGVASMFAFGRGYGAMRMGLIATEIPFDEVIPRKWQAAMMCLTGGDKNVSKRRAQELFPQIKITHSIGDALLLAEYGRRTALGIK